MANNWRSSLPVYAAMKGQNEKATKLPWDEHVTRLSRSSGPSAAHRRHVPPSLRTLLTVQGGRDVIPAGVLKWFSNLVAMKRRTKQGLSFDRVPTADHIDMIRSKPTRTHLKKKKHAQSINY